MIRREEIPVICHTQNRADWITLVDGEIFSFCMREFKVVRFMPRRSAAPPGPPILFGFSEHTDDVFPLNVLQGRRSGGRTSFCRHGLKKRESSGPGPLDRITARSMTCSNSRILPGQEYRHSAPIPSGDTISNFFFIRWENFDRKYWTSNGMSSRRSRSGGTVMGKTFSR